MKAQVEGVGQYAVEFVLGDVLQSDVPAIVMAIDDAAPGMGGAIARKFERCYPDSWEEIEQDIQYQLGLGRAQILKVEPGLDCPNYWVIFCSTLHHVDVIDRDGRLRILRSAFKEALALAANKSVEVVGTAVMVGGWRLSLVDAASVMLKGYFEQLQVRGWMPRLKIFVIDESDFAKLSEGLANDFSVVSTNRGCLVHTQRSRS